MSSSISSTCTVSSGQITIHTTLTAGTTYFSMSVGITGFTNPSLIDYSGYFGFQIQDSLGTVLSKTVDNTYKFTLIKAKLKGTK